MHVGGDDAVLQGQAHLGQATVAEREGEYDVCAGVEKWL